MSATTSPALADELETLKSRLDALETKNDQLEARVGELENQNHELTNRVDTLEAENTELQNTVDDQAETIESQHADFAEYKARVRKLETTTESARAHRKRLQQQFHELTTDDVASLSPLQQVVAFSKDAVEKLTPNEKRARYVAKGISDYATKVPAGYTIDSSTISTVLRSKDGESPHTETVSRVMEFLNRFGKDETKIVKRRGTKRVVFTEQAVADLESATSEDTRSITDVVMWWRQ